MQVERRYTMGFFRDLKFGVPVRAQTVEVKTAKNGNEKLKKIDEPYVVRKVPGGYMFEYDDGGKCFISKADIGK